MSFVGSRNKIVRDEWVIRSLKKIPPGSRILDAGAGEQQYKQFCSHLEYVSQDFGQYNGKGDGVGLHTNKWNQKGLDIVSDITSIPEPDESFDAILCTEVIEHLPDPIEGIREISRLLRPRGHLIITAPFCSLTHFAPYHFYTGFNVYFYEAVFKRFGLEIIEVEANGNFFEFLAQEIRRIPSIRKKYTKAGNISFIERFAIKRILSMLEFCSSIDNGSSEVLNYGYHVYAIKKGQTNVKE